MLECGLYQGRRRESAERNRNLPFDAASVDVLILSHAHIDHSGNIPNLVRNGFRGSVYCTFATRDLCSAMLRDSAYIQERDVEYVNKKRARRGEEPIEPIYTHADAVASLEHFVSVGYDRPVLVAPGVRCTFLDAGHILGSATVTLDCRENGATKRLLYTGDLGRKAMPILRDPVVVGDVDYLITESTYGNRTHPAKKDVEKTLLALCRLSPFKWLSFAAGSYVNFFRSMPLILVIFWFYFLVPFLLGRPVGGFYSVLVAFIMFEAAYYCEIMRAGIQSVRLADHGVKLEPGVSYQWLVKLVPRPDDRSYDRIVGGGVERVEASTELAAVLADPEASRAHELAKGGIWYDAIDALSTEIEANPGDATLWNQRTALFEQVGLPELPLEEGSAPGLERSP